MNEENNKKRNKIIIIVAVLFLLTAGIITVYSFKNTKAEEIESMKVDTIAECPKYYTIMNDRSGCYLKNGTNITTTIEQDNDTFVAYYSYVEPYVIEDIYKFISIESTLIVSGFDSLTESGNKLDSNIYKNDDSKEIIIDNYGRFRTTVPYSSFDASYGVNDYCVNNHCCLLKTNHDDVAFQYYEGVDGKLYGPQVVDTFNYITTYISKNSEGTYDYKLLYFIRDLQNVYPYGKLRSNFLRMDDNCVVFYNKPMMSVTYSVGDNGVIEDTSDNIITKTYLATNYNSTTIKADYLNAVRDGYVFKGWKVSDSDNVGHHIYYSDSSLIEIGFASSEAHDDYYVNESVTLEAVWEKEDSSDPNHPSLYSVYYKDSAGNNTVDTKTGSSSDFTINNGKTDYCVGTDANKMFSYWKNMTVTSDTNKYCLDTASGCTESITIPSGKTSVILKAVCNSNSGGGDTPNHYSVYYKDSIGNNTVYTKTHSSSNFTIINGKNDYCVGTDANKIFSYWKNTTDTSDTKKYCLDTASGCTESITITSGRNATLKAVCSSNSGGGDTPKYTLTLKKNCSGTFKCVSDTNSEVCNQLKNNGKFTKTIAKGDTFTFPKTFDTLTCDGNEINSWGNFELGQELEIKSNIIASAKWKSSSGGGDTPSTDEYTVTLKKNCSGTFVCSSSVNSELCNQLKSNGKFTKNVTKGDTFIFPKTFDALTCDGENIDKWGIYNLGSSITVNSNITASAKWKNSSSIDDPSDDPSDDPIDNPQTGSIVIYLVLLFGIGALAYSVWYFRGFRKN